MSRTINKKTSGAEAFEEERSLYWEAEYSKRDLLSVTQPNSYREVVKKYD